jgi:hypothetical protein
MNLMLADFKLREERTTKSMFIRLIYFFNLINYELIRTVLGNQTNVEQFLEVAEQRNLVA